MSRQRHQPGDLTELMSLSRRTRTPDGSGGFRSSSDEYARVRASVRPLYGSERFTSDRLEAQAGYLVTIRNRPDVREEDTLRWHQQDRSLNIRFVRRQSARSLYLELETDMGVAS